MLKHKHTTAATSHNQQKEALLCTSSTAMNPFHAHPSSTTNSRMSMNEDVSMASSIGNKTVEELLCATVTSMSVSEAAESMYGNDKGTEKSVENKSLDDFTLSLTQLSSDIRATGGRMSVGGTSKSLPFVAEDNPLAAPKTPFVGAMVSFSSAPEPSPLTITPAMRGPHPTTDNMSRLGSDGNYLQKWYEHQPKPAPASSPSTVTIGHVGDEHPSTCLIAVALETLNTSTSLRYLDIRISVEVADLYSSEVEAVVHSLPMVLERNPRLEYLKLDSILIDDNIVLAIAKSLEANTALQELYLISNWIRDKEATAIAQALERNETLQSLSFERNFIGDIGAAALAKALGKNVSLQYLDLNWTFIGDKGAVEIAKALEKNEVLRQLRITVSLFGDEGATALRKAGSRVTRFKYDQPTERQDPSKLHSVECVSPSLDFSPLEIEISSNNARENMYVYPPPTSMYPPAYAPAEPRRSGFGGEPPPPSMYPPVPPPPSCDNTVYTPPQTMRSGFGGRSTENRLQLPMIGTFPASTSPTGETDDDDVTIDLNCPRQQGNTAEPDKTFSPSKDDRIYVDESTITVHDVVGGSDSTGSNRPGNVSYRDLIEKNKSYHHSLLGNYKERTKIRNMIVDEVINRGGRFIKKENGRFYLLTLEEAQRKVTEALKPRKSRAKTP